MEKENKEADSVEEDSVKEEPKVTVSSETEEGKSSDVEEEKSKDWADQVEEEEKSGDIECTSKEGREVSKGLAKELREWLKATNTPRPQRQPSGT